MYFEYLGAALNRYLVVPNLNIFDRVFQGNW